MESLVVTLETAKKLKAAKFPQIPCAYYWWHDPFSNWQLRRGQMVDVDGLAAAPTAQETADQIDDHLSVHKASARLWSSTIADTDLLPSGPTMAEALAALWLKLHEVQS